MAKSGFDPGDGEENLTQKNQPEKCRLARQKIELKKFVYAPPPLKAKKG